MDRHDGERKICADLSPVGRRCRATLVQEIEEGRRDQGDHATVHRFLILRSEIAWLSRDRDVLRPLHLSDGDPVASFEST